MGKSSPSCPISNLIYSSYTGMLEVPLVPKLHVFILTEHLLKKKKKNLFSFLHCTNVEQTKKNPNFLGFKY